MVYNVNTDHVNLYTRGNIMRKYKNLYDYLKVQDTKTVTLSFEDVEELIYGKLPRSAFRYRQWWANGGHVQAYSWMNAGYLVKKVDFKEKTVVFEIENHNIKAYNKLVRDKVPEIIEADGKKCVVEVLGDFEFLFALDAKLDEELAEYHKDHSVEELADLLEVIYAAALARGYTEEALERLRTEKRESRGGFEKKLLLRKVEE